MQRLSKWLVGALLLTWAPEALAINRVLLRAKRAYEQLEYDAVVPLLHKALEADNLPAEEIEIFALLATMHVMYGRDADAEEAFVHVLERKPEFALPEDASPKLSAALEAARQVFANRRPEPTAGDGGGQEGGDVARDEPDAAGAGGDRIADPMMVDPIAPPTPFYSTWWFWTAVGAVVVAAGTSAYLLTQPRFPEPAFGPYDL